jgi:monothiol glutaredoxin
MTMSGELDTLFESENISYDKDAASKIREANTE